MFINERFYWLAVAIDSLGGRALITLTNLQSGYEGEPLHEPLSGQFEGGSMTAIIGQNGAGKSTFIKTVCDLIPAISGQAEINGSISWLPQHSDVDRQFPISVSEVVAMGCWPKVSLFRRLAKSSQEAVKHALEAVGITALADKSIDKLSEGQFQRMLFARMLVQDADIMILDEPFNGIDENTQAVLAQILQQQHQQGKTIIAVLHDIQLVQQHYPSTLLFDKNRIVWDTTNNVVKHLTQSSPTSTAQLHL